MMEYPLGNDFIRGFSGQLSTLKAFRTLVYESPPFPILIPDFHFVQTAGKQGTPMPALCYLLIHAPQMVFVHTKLTIGHLELQFRRHYFLPLPAQTAQVIIHSIRYTPKDTRQVKAH